MASSSNPVLDLPATTASPAAVVAKPAPGESSPAPSPRRPPVRRPYSRAAIAQANSSSKGIFAHIHVFHLVVAFFALLQIIMASISVATNNWYSINDGTTIQLSGLFKSCTSDGNCKPLEFPTLYLGTCTREGSTTNGYYNVIRSLNFAGIGISAAALLVALTAKKLPASPAIWTILCIVLMLGALATLFATMYFYSWVQTMWLWCDVDYCQWRQKQGVDRKSCDASYGFSAATMCVAIGCALLGLFFAILRFIFREWNIAATDDGTTSSAGAAASPKRDAHEPTTVIPVSRPDPTLTPRAVAPEPAPMNPPPEGGDWVYDATSGMYWSELEYLYLDPETRHCYDPKSGQWYDPDTQEWYQGE